MSRSVLPLVALSARCAAFAYATIDPAARACPSRREYGQPNSSIGYGVSGLILGDQAANAITGAVTTSATPDSDVGSYTISGSFGSPAGYVVDVAAGTLAVVPATLVYVADPHTRIYGEPNGTLSGTVTGLHGDDTLADVATGIVSWTTDATTSSDVGAYTINGSGLSARNYVFAQAPANATALSVTPATLTYVAAPVTRVYGEPNGTLSGTVIGLRGKDALADVATGTPVWNSDATPSSDVGSYSITGSGLIARNYVFVQAPGNAKALTVTPATLTYVADPRTRVYGDPNGTLSGAIAGLRGDDTLDSAVTGTPEWSTDATVSSDVGTYPITGAGLSARNYVFVQSPGNATAMKITPATLIFVADPRSREVGTPNGTLHGSLAGFRNGDTVDSATTGTIEWRTEADRLSPVGSYAISGDGLHAKNYVFAQHPANATALEVLPVAQTYTLELMRDPLDTYLYDRNAGAVGMCPAPSRWGVAPDQEGDELLREWSRVRSRPNVASCVTVMLDDGCSSF